MILEQAKLNKILAVLLIMAILVSVMPHTTAHAAGESILATEAVTGLAASTGLSTIVVAGGLIVATAAVAYGVGVALSGSWSPTDVLQYYYDAITLPDSFITETTVDNYGKINLTADQVTEINGYIQDAVESSKFQFVEDLIGTNHTITNGTTTLTGYIGYETKQTEKTTGIKETSIWGTIYYENGEPFIYFCHSYYQDTESYISPAAPYIFINAEQYICDTVTNTWIKNSETYRGTYTETTKYQIVDKIKSSSATTAENYDTNIQTWNGDTPADINITSSALGEDFVQDLIEGTAEAEFTEVIDTGPMIKNGTSTDEFSDAITDIRTKLKSGFGEVVDTITNIGTGIKDTVTEAINAIEGVGQNIVDGIQEIIENISGSFSGETPEGIEPVFTIIDNLKETLENAKSNFLGIWHYVVDWMNSIAAGTAAIKSIFSILPYAMVVPIYATLVIVIVLGLLSKFLKIH